MTRKEYLNGGSHNAYFGQYVTETTKRTVLAAFGFERLKAAHARGANMDSIPLALWDALPVSVPCGAMEANGDYLTLSGKVCILKQAALQIVLAEGGEA